MIIDVHVSNAFGDMRTCMRCGEYSVTPGSPWPSELLAVIATARRHGVQEIIEGGTYLGQSAWAFATFTPAVVRTFDLDVEAVQQARVRFERAGLPCGVYTPRPAPSGVRVIAEVADAYKEIPHQVECAAQHGLPHGVFLDGPKGTTSLVLVQQLLEMDVACMRFIAVHDTYASVLGRPNPIAVGLQELGRYTPHWRVWTTEDAEWGRGGVRALDVDLYEQHRRLPHGWQPWTRYAHGVAHEMASYGPTVTVLERL